MLHLQMVARWRYHRRRNIRAHQTGGKKSRRHRHRAVVCRLGELGGGCEGGGGGVGGWGFGFGLQGRGREVGPGGMGFLGLCVCVCFFFFI